MKPKVIIQDSINIEDYKYKYLLLVEKKQIESTKMTPAQLADEMEIKYKIKTTEIQELDCAEGFSMQTNSFENFTIVLYKIYSNENFHYADYILSCFRKIMLESYKYTTL